MFNKLKKLFKKKEARNDNFLIKPKCKFCKAQIQKRKYIHKTECCGGILHHKCNNKYVFHFNHCPCCNKRKDLLLTKRNRKFLWLLLL